jgi:phosphopantothenoylcysteine decarboxylase/phosphopantothenate--cysteine ligase
MEGARVICVMTPSAKHFVTPLILKTFSGNPVYEDFFTTDACYGVLHTDLQEAADLILVAPASANFLAKMRCGLADDLASCILLATRKPVLIAPAMNDLMYEHPMTQTNMAQLKAIGYEFVDPIKGMLACGREGVGHVAEPNTIVDRVESLLKNPKRISAA